MRRRLFHENGFEISGASTNPFTALEEIRTSRPDAVLSDLKMPELSGIELLEELQKDTFKPLFIIISAYKELKDVRKLFLTHGFDYLVKPIADSDLVDLLLRLAGKIDYIMPEAEKQTQSQKLNEILCYLNEYSAMNHTLDSIAERFSINQSTICKLFSKHLNTTFTAHLNALRMKHAQTLLRSTNKPIKEIAATCGYSDYFYFCRVFQKTHGIAPTRYREAANEK
jgi:YesN/AraC family two-component response regulator